MSQPKCIPQLSAKDIKRFWSKVDIRGPGECWPWKFCTNRLGYGKFQIGKSTQVRAHRVAFSIIKGNPGVLMVLHSCDTPRCCNPEHLFKGDAQDNMTDKVSKGRVANGTKCNKRKFTEETILEIRALREQGLSLARIARMHNTSGTNINSIVSRKTWKHI